ncbi:MAG: geranylgeranyl reductase family protein [Planctomycetes bacterium]|nr:geranylgeranyl reductase family protein [Planctomycetota bacterium]
MGADVVIIGAGPAGTTAAFYLAKGGADVVLLDRAEFPRDKVCGDALSPHALDLLRRMGVPGPDSDLHMINGAILFAPDGRRVRTFTAEPGAVIPRRRLDQMLLERAIGAGVRFHPQERFTGLKAARGGVQVRTGPTHSWTGRCAILATGCSGGPLRAVGVLRGGARVHTFARRAYFDGVSCPPDRIVYSFDQSLLPRYGWIFPMGGGRANVGVAGEYETGAQLRIGERFQWFITRSLAARRFLQDAHQATPARTAALRTGLRGVRLAAERMLVVGEAAAAVRASTGEGIPIAVETGRLAAETLLEALRDDDLTRFRLASYGRAVRERFDAELRRGEFVSRMLRSPRLANEYFRLMEGDQELADRLAWVMVGTKGPRELLTWPVVKQFLLQACSLGRGIRA